MGTTNERMIELLDTISGDVAKLNKILMQEIESGKATESNKKTSGKLSSLIVEEDDDTKPRAQTNLEDKVVFDYNNNETNETIQKRYGISNGRIYTILRQKGVDLRRGKSKAEERVLAMGDETRTAVIDEYTIGSPARAIMAYYKLNKNTLYTLLDMYDVPRRL